MHRALERNSIGARKDHAVLASDFMAVAEIGWLIMALS